MTCGKLSLDGTEWRRRAARKSLRAEGSSRLKTKDLCCLANWEATWQDQRSGFSRSLLASNPQFFPQLAQVVTLICTGKAATFLLDLSTNCLGAPESPGLFLCAQWPAVVSDQPYLVSGGGPCGRRGGIRNRLALRGGSWSRHSRLDVVGRNHRVGDICRLSGEENRGLLA